MTDFHTKTDETILSNQKLEERRLIQLPIEEKIYIFDQLATELESGTPLVTAFQAKVEEFNFLRNKQTDRRAFLISGKPQGEKFVREMAVLLADLGKQFNEAAEQFPGIFDPQFLAILNAAQQTGQYGSALRRQVQYLTEQKMLRDHIKGVLRYPILVLGVAIIVIAIAFVWVIPGFVSLYEGLIGNNELNWTTQLLLNTSQIFTDHWLAIILGLVGTIYGYIWIRKSFLEIRRKEHQFFLKIPKINRYIATIDVLNFLNSFILLREAGETLTKSFVMAVESITNSEIREKAQNAAVNFERGTPQHVYLALAQAHPIFSEASSVYSQLKTYEEYASLEQLERFTKILKHNADRLRDELAGYVQPASMVIIGGVVGFILFALYIPMFELIGKLASR